MKRVVDESGQVLVLAALSLTLLVGMVALATDVGMLFRARELMQNAADSAAIAGAAEINYADVTAAARADAAQNGVTNGVNGAVVTVNNPPTSGPNTGNTGYVEVIVSEPQPTFFMKLFSWSSMNVSARAVAAASPSNGCIVTLQANPQTPTGKKGAMVTVPGIDDANSASLTLTSCSVIDNASGSGALTVTGAGSITAAGIGVVGTTTYSGSGTTTPTPVTISPVADPLASTVTTPPATDWSSGCLTDPSITKSQTIPMPASGYVCYNGLSFPKGSPTVTLSPGLYIINGQGTANAYGLNVASGTVLNGSGVTFYFVNGGNFQITNGATLTLTPPTSGNYSGMLFYQDASDIQSDAFVGGSSGSLTGIIYLPAANLSYENGTTATFTVDLVVGSLNLTGNAQLKPYAPLSGAALLGSPRLAE
jgi:hypothetical protein